MSKPTLYSDNEGSENFLEEMQSSLIKKFAKIPAPPEPLIYELTDDRALLHQYYLLREQMYRKVFQTDKFVGEEDVHDKLSHILIARRGKLCIGGVRLTIREADEDFALPMENPDFKLRTIFPNLPLRDVRHGEISRFAVMEDTDHHEVLYGLCKLLYDMILMNKAHYVFAKSTLALARNWRMIAKGLGVKDSKICMDIDVPENPIHPEIKWYMTLLDFASFYAPNESLAKAAEPSAPALKLVADAGAKNLMPENA